MGFLMKDIEKKEMQGVVESLDPSDLRLLDMCIRSGPQRVSPIWDSTVGLQGQGLCMLVKIRNEMHCLHTRRGFQVWEYRHEIPGFDR